MRWRGSVALTPLRATRNQPWSITPLAAARPLPAENLETTNVKTCRACVLAHEQIQERGKPDCEKNVEKKNKFEKKMSFF